MPEQATPVVYVQRASIRLLPDPRRVLAKPFTVGDTGRTKRILGRIAALPDAAVPSLLAACLRRFASRHRNIDAILARSFRAVEPHVELRGTLSIDRQRLIGAYFTHEYAIESAALTNPSLVLAPDQSKLEPGSARFYMSVRSIGEGHISSIQFRSGVITSTGDLTLEKPGPHITAGEAHVKGIEKQLFANKLQELHSLTRAVIRVLDALPTSFSLDTLESTIRRYEETSGEDEVALAPLRTMHWLAVSNYNSHFDVKSTISERIIFPESPTESQGMEDARFVRFRRDDGSHVYLAPYTAFDGREIMTQLIETSDFTSFRMTTLNGNAARNKGIAIFPRKVGGEYLALGRIDNENNYLMRTNNLHFWNDHELLQAPVEPWELIQIGNAGSPIETAAGWLVITHGVGPFREYSLGAMLLDLHDPTRVIGSLRQPLLTARADEREGYVPNVVYSCGSICVDNRVLVPFGFSDHGTTIALVPLQQLLEALTHQ